MTGCACTTNSRARPARRRFRVLRYDTRGHGASAVPDAPFGMAELGADVLAVMDHAGVERAHFCGLSMGGMTGIWMGIHQARRLDRLVLCNTAALIGPASTWNARIEKVRNAKNVRGLFP